MNFHREASKKLFKIAVGRHPGLHKANTSVGIKGGNHAY